MTNNVRINVTADQTGADLGKSRRESAELRDQVEKDAAAMKAASDRVDKARVQEENTAGRVRVAELKLAEARENSKIKASQMAQAEENLERAQRAAAAAVKSSADATDRLKDARDRAAASAASGPVVHEEETRQSFKLDMSKSVLDKGALLSNAKAVGIEAGALLAGGLASGLSTVGAAGMFVGIAAAAQSSNQQVRAVYSDMWAQIKAGAQQDSAAMAGTFITAAESLGRTFNALRPQLAEGMAAAKPAVADLTDGIDRMARQAMPGLVTGAKAAKDETKGLADMMDSTGKGVGNFFTESAQGAAAGGDAFRSFGNIVERMGSFAGRIFAELANDSGTVFPEVEHVVDSAATTIEHLAHVALPGVAAGAGLALSGLGLLLNLMNSLIGVLGPLIPLASTFATSMKLIDMVSFGQVGASWDRLKTSIGEAEGFTGKAKAGFSSLLSGGMLPLVVGGIAVTGLLNELSKDQQRAAEATKAHEQNVSNLAAALRQSKGALDDNVRAAAAQALINTKVGDSGKNVLETAKNIGVSLPKLTDGFMGNRAAMADVNTQLDSIIAAGTTYVETETSKQAITNSSADAARMLKIALASGNTELAEAILKNEALTGATGQSAQSTNKLAGEFKTLSNDASSAQQKIDALVRIMDEMAGRKPDLEQATRAWEEFIDSFNKKDGGFESKAAGTKKWAEALLNADGTINLTTKDGRTLFDLVQKGEKDFAATGEAMKASGADAAETRMKLQGLREEFVRHAMQLGYTSTEAQKLADKYGMIPTNVATLVSSNLAPEIQKAITLGGFIRTLPDKTVEVITTTGAAQQMINKFIQTNDGRVITLHTNVVSGVTLNTTGGSFSRLRAAGGPVSHAAEGGARSGPVMVNERGLMEGIRTPGGDLVDMESGSSVVPHANMQSMRANAQPVINLQVFIGEHELRDITVKSIQSHVRTAGGGNVQLALGKAS